MVLVAGRDKGANMAQLLAPEAYRGAGAAGGRNRGPLRNHARENVRAIREASAASREARENAGPEKPLYKMKQFENVASRLNEPSKKVPPLRAGSAEHKPFLRRGTREELPTPAEVHARKAQGKVKLGTKWPPPAPAADYSEDRTPRKEPCPSRREVLKLKEKNEVDRIALNRARAVAAPPRAKPTQQVRPAKHDSFGRTPDYIDKRKVELRMEAEERRRDAPDPDAPPGMVQMADAERLDMLATLNQRKRDLEAEHYKLPLNITTQRQKHKQADLENALSEVDRSIDIFSRPVVYIQA